MQKYTKFLPLLIVGLLFIFQLATQVRLAITDSQTTDEGIHLAAGYTYWQYKDWRINPEHPLLVKFLAGLPLYWLQPHEPTGLIDWTQPNPYLYDNWRTDRAYGENLLYSVGNNADLVLFSSRLPMILVSVLLGLLILGASWKLWGPWAGVVSYAVFVLDPNFMAHGHFVTTDVGMSFAFLGSILAFWGFWQQMSWQRALLFGVTVGLTFATKFTAVILLPVLAILTLYLWQTQPVKRKPLQLTGYFKLAVIAAFLTVWATYGFDIRQVPSLDGNTNSSELTFEAVQLENQPLLADPLRLYLVPEPLRSLMIPRDFYKGLFQVVNHVSFGHNAYLFGETSRTGWWYYFPVVIAVKTPLPTLILFGLALAWAIKRRDQMALYLCLASFVYLACAMLSKADLGIRHIFPVFPPLFVAIGSLAQAQWQRKQSIVALLLVLLGIEAAITAPYYISYFNQLGGGTGNGYRIIVDSNIEWGQDLKRLRDYLQEHPEIQRPYIEYYWDGLSSLGYYNIDHQYLSDLIDNPEKRHGYAIIGVSELMKEKYEWLRSYPLVEKITPSLWVFKMD